MIMMILTKKNTYNKKATIVSSSRAFRCHVYLLRYAMQRRKKRDDYKITNSYTAKLLLK
jgi:hypothetical protein